MSRPSIVRSPGALVPARRAKVGKKSMPVASSAHTPPAGAMPGHHAISGTRKNMLSEALLDGAAFPEIRLTSRSVAGRAPDYRMTVAVEVKGQTHDLQVPVQVEKGAKELRATGAFTVNHAELGLTPFTVMGGLLSVRDEIKLRFRIVARPWHTAAP